jgi:addiction module RelB/DinJ family antitoxin
MDADHERYPGAISQNITVVYTSVMQTVLNVKTDAKLKKEAQKLAKELGLPLSAVVTRLLRDFVRDGEIAFSSAPRMTPALEELIGRFETDRAKGVGVSRTFDSVEDVLEYLDNQ